MVDQVEIDLLVRRRDRLIGERGSERRLYEGEGGYEDNMSALFMRASYGYDTWEAIAKDALKELEKYR